MEQRMARDELKALLERAILEDDAEAREAARQSSFVWEGLDGMSVNDVLIDGLSKRIDRANLEFDRALFIDIPARFGRKLRDLAAESSQVDEKAVAAVRADASPLSPDERNQIVEAIDRYRGVMESLRAVLALPFIPAERRERLEGQLRAVESGSQASTLTDLERFSLPLTAEVLRKHPLDA